MDHDCCIHLGMGNGLILFVCSLLPSVSIGMTISYIESNVLCRQHLVEANEEATAAYNRAVSFSVFMVY